MPAHAAVWSAPPLRLPSWLEHARAWVVSLAKAAGTPVAPDPAARRREDLALARRVRRGDSQAEGELLDRLLPHLRVVARAILTNPADVDDAVQVALMRVLEGLPSYRGDSSLVRWSRRVAAHACLRLREQNQRRLRVVELQAEVPTAAEPAPAPSLGEGLSRELAEYLDTLSEPQREALVLRHVLDHSVAEVAELVGAPVDTVKSRLLYARRALRSLIRRDAAMEPRRKGASA